MITTKDFHLNPNIRHSMENDNFSELINIMNCTLDENDENIYGLSRENVHEAMRELFKRQKNPMEYLRSFKYRNIDELLLPDRSLYYTGMRRRQHDPTGAFDLRCISSKKSGKTEKRAGDKQPVSGEYKMVCVPENESEVGPTQTIVIDPSNGELVRESSQVAMRSTNSDGKNGQAWIADLCERGDSDQVISLDNEFIIEMIDLEKDGYDFTNQSNQYNQNNQNNNSTNSTKTNNKSKPSKTSNKNSKSSQSNNLTKTGKQSRDHSNNQAKQNNHSVKSTTHDLSMSIDMTDKYHLYSPVHSPATKQFTLPATSTHLRRYFLPTPVIHYHLIKTSHEHEATITTLFIDRSNRYFLSGDDTGIIKLYSLHTGNCIDELVLHHANINDINISLCGQYLISSDGDGNVCISDLVTRDASFYKFNSSVLLVESLRESIMVLESSGMLNRIDRQNNVHVNDVIPKCNGAVGAVCISEGANILLVGGSFPFLLLFNLNVLHNEAVVLDTDGYGIAYVCASRRRTIFLCSTYYNHLFYFEFNVGKGTSNYRKNDNTCFWRKHRIQLELGEYDYIEKIVFLADDRYFITTCTDCRLRLFRNREIVQTMENVSGNLLAHPVFNVFMVFSRDIRIYDTDMNVVQCISLDFSVTEVAFSDDGYSFVVSNEIGNVYVYSLFPSVPAGQHDRYVVRHVPMPVNDVELACLDSLKAHSMDIARIRKKYFPDDRKRSESTASDISDDPTTNTSYDDTMSSPSTESSVRGSRNQRSTRTRTINVINSDSYVLPTRSSRKIISSDTPSPDAVADTPPAKRPARRGQRTKKVVHDDSTDSCCKKDYTVKKRRTSPPTDSSLTAMSDTQSEHDGDTTTFSDLTSLSDMY